MIRCYITDSRALGGVPQLLASLPQIIGHGVDWIQVREKHLEARHLLHLVGRIVDIARPAGVKVIVNSRPDIGLIAGADGVHLPGNSIGVKSWRQIVPADWLIGVSTHSVSEALDAERAGASYVLLSPIFESLSKPGYGPALGLVQLRMATEALRIPVLALGGVNRSNADSCTSAGAAGVAGISLFQR